LSQSNILIGILLVLLVYFIVKDLFFQEDENPVPQFLIDQLKDNAAEIESLKHDSKANRVLIQSVKNENEIKDSIIYNATDSELDSLLNEFWSATR